MSANSFMNNLSLAFRIGGAITGIMFAAFWWDDKICDQDEQIEELVSRLEDCEEKNELEK